MGLLSSLEVLAASSLVSSDFEFSSFNSLRISLFDIKIDISWSFMLSTFDSIESRTVLRLSSSAETVSNSKKYFHVKSSPPFSQFFLFHLLNHPHLLRNVHHWSFRQEFCWIPSYFVCPSEKKCRRSHEIQKIPSTQPRQIGKRFKLRSVKFLSFFY